MKCFRLLPSCVFVIFLQLAGSASAAPVANDSFANAIIITGSSGTRTGNNTGAGKQSGEPDHAGNPGGASVWYRWTAPASGRFSFNTWGSSFDTLLAVYTGGSLASLVEVTSNDDYGFDVTSELSFLAAAGTVYQVAVDGFDGETGSLILNWAPEVAPANDNFANATVITGTNGTINGNNTGATKQAGEPLHAGEEGGRSVWFRWTAPRTGPMVFNTLGSVPDTLLAVYTGASVNALTPIASNDNGEEGVSSSLTFQATNGITYSVAIDGFLRHAGALVLNWFSVTNEVPDTSLYTFRTLHHFTNAIDGAAPQAEVILANRTLYGTTTGGGTTGNGTVFKVNTDGNGYAILHNFVYSGGATPFAGLVLSSNTLYGTTRAGGSFGWGTVFAIKTNGTGYTPLHHFAAAPGDPATNANGALPHAPITVSPSGQRLYGTTTVGGRWGNGVLFALNSDGTGFTNLYTFSALPVERTNSDGANPYSALILSGNRLYGTTINGGAFGGGTVFALNTNGTGFITLRHLDWGTDGGTPHTAILAGNRLYGTCNGGGQLGNGTVFALNTDGTGFTNLYRFSGVSGPTFTNKTGSSPWAGLALAGDTLYGTTLGGGAGGKGTLYSVKTNGTSFKSLYHFTTPTGPAGTNSDGATLRGGVAVDADALYGTAERGGDRGQGTVFSLSLIPRPQLLITLARPNVILSWPASAGAFAVEGNTNLAPGGSWSAVAGAATTNSGEVSVTIPASGERKFFRLKGQ